MSEDLVNLAIAGQALKASQYELEMMRSRIRAQFFDAGQYLMEEDRLWFSAQLSVWAEQLR